MAAIAVATAAVCGLQAPSAAVKLEPVSTPVTMSTPDGRLMSYIVNGRIADPGQTRLVGLAVQAAGGTVVQSWPEIGVVVAHSTMSTFRDDVLMKGGNAIASVGASRTVPVREGTPPPARDAWDPGAPDHETGSQKDWDGDLRPDGPPPPRPTRPTRASRSSGTCG